VAVDRAGNIFVTDTGNDTIRKITPTGVVSTLAGTVGLRGSEDGTGAAAHFKVPRGGAVDGAGNIFVADSGNSSIRRITPLGVVTTVVDNTGAAVSFNIPCGVAVDGAGNIFVADCGNSTIWKISAAGVVTTLAGTAGLVGSADGAGAAASFNNPSGVAVDGTGNVVVADARNNTIRKVTPAGVVTTLAGTAGLVGSADGAGAAASFNNPSGVAADGVGNVFVADCDNNTIRKITPSGVVTTLADGTGGPASFGGPTGVAVDGEGNVFVAGNFDDTIRKITPAGVVTTLAGSATAQSESADGTGAAARFNGPDGVAVDEAGNVFVADRHSNTIRKVTPAGVVTTLAGSATAAPGSSDGTGAAASFNFPCGVAVDGAGNLFVADSFNDTIRKVTPAGVVTTLAGSAGSLGSADGTGDAARFDRPQGVAVDGAGNLFVTDMGNDTIRKITPSGVVTTLAGSATAAPESADGTGSDAHFNRPQGVAMDGANSLFVTENGTIRKVTPAGVVTTLAGTAGLFGSADGIGADARFNAPYGAAVDQAGNIFVADCGNNAIRKITASGVVTTVVGVAAQTSVGNLPGPLPASIICPNGVAVDSSGTRLTITLVDAVMVALLPN
jgi:sugar lactone lactonase YvrE